MEIFARFFDAGERAVRERPVARVGHQLVKRRVDIDRRTFLRARRILRFVRTRVVQPAARTHRRAVEFEPALERAFARHAVERPLHRNALHVKRVPVVFGFEDFRDVSEIVSRLNRIPAEMIPLRRGFLFIDDERHRSGVKKHLHFSAEVVAVDHIQLTARLREPRDRATPIEVDAESDDAIVKEAHLRLRLRRLRVRRRGEEQPGDKGGQGGEKVHRFVLERRCGTVLNRCRYSSVIVQSLKSKTRLVLPVVSVRGLLSAW